MPLMLLVCLALCLSVAGCPAPAPPVQAPRSVPAGPRLRLDQGTLYVTGLDSGYRRGALLYVHAAQPLPGATTHEHIAIVQGVDRQGDALTVMWYCPPRDSDQAIPQDGLPVSGLEEDTEARLGACWGRYLPAPDDASLPAAGVVDLTLDLGQQDQVRDGWVFEILGEPHADPLNRIVMGFDVLGYCSILPDSAIPDRARCRLDRGESPAFTLAAWRRGGYAHHRQPPAR